MQDMERETFSFQLLGESEVKVVFFIDGYL